MPIDRTLADERIAEINALLDYLDLHAHDMIELVKQASQRANQTVLKSREIRVCARAVGTRKKRT